MIVMFNPLSPKIDFYVDLLICATSLASNHKFMLLSKIFQETYYIMTLEGSVTLAVRESCHCRILRC